MAILEPYMAQILKVKGNLMKYKLSDMVVNWRWIVQLQKTKSLYWVLGALSLWVLWTKWQNPRRERGPNGSQKYPAKITRKCTTESIQKQLAKKTKQVLKDSIILKNKFDKVTEIRKRMQKNSNKNLPQALPNAGTWRI